MMDSKDIKKEEPEEYVDPIEFLEKELAAIKLPRREDYDDLNTDGYGKEASCHLNVFNLNLDNTPSTIYKYELIFTLTKKTGEEYQLHNALIRVNDQMRSFKRSALIILSRMVHDQYPDFFRKQQLGDSDKNNWRQCCAFDCGVNYYTAVDIGSTSGVLEDEVYKKSCYVKYFLPRASGQMKWDLTLVETFRIDGENAKSPQAQQFLEVLTKQKLIRNEDVDVKPDAAYLKGGDFTRDNKELRKGIVTAVKVTGDNVSIQLDSKISLFFPEICLLDYIRRVTGIRSDRDLEYFLKDRVKSRHLRKELLNLPLRCRHIETRKTFECKGFHTDSASGTKFTTRDSEDPVSVADYYEQKYKYRVRSPGLPLIVERVAKDKNSYFPLEVLDIASGIRVSNQKMSREAQDNMIKTSCRAPLQLGRDLCMSRDAAQINSNNKYFKSFNVKVNGDFAMVDGHILAKPNLVGMAGIKPDMNDRGQIAFTKNNYKFADPAKPPLPITMVNMDRTLSDRDVDNLKDTMTRFSRDFGMQIEFSRDRDPGLFGGQVEPMREFMSSKKGKTSMFFYVTKEKMDESHDMVKKLEQELGVVTQLVCLQTAQGIMQNKRTTAYNVIAKMNQKLGGVNANPEVPPELKNTLPDVHARAAQDWFHNRMFVGLTLSHGGPLSFADRVVGQQVREPTCVGMAFTLRQPGQRTAMSWFQERRKAIIDDLTRHFVRALDIYAESNKGHMPNSIVIFRKGMSEGELQKAAYEMHQVNDAIIEINKRPGTQPYNPTIQCVVCMANTADRIFYGPGDANVPCGMVLDKGATNPDRVEFLIVPHNAIKGTSKAVRCTLVHDYQGKVGRKLAYGEIQSIYHTMCYLNGVAAGPTRLPVPLSDSEKAAERQMNNYKESMRSGDDTRSVCSGGSEKGGAIDDGTPEFYKKLSDQFDHKFKTNQYYA